MGVDEKENPATSFRDLLACRYRFFYFDKMLTDLKASITIPLQQMPHAISISWITILESLGEKSQRQCARRSRWRWLISELYGVIGAKKVWRILEGSWRVNKRDVVALICLMLEIRRGRVAQTSKLCLIIKRHR